VSPRKRHSKPSIARKSPDAAELTRAVIAREGYPAAEARQAIFERRGEILRLMIEDMVINEGRAQEARTRRFVHQYGERDTLAVLKAMQNGFQRPFPLGDEAWLYRQYRQAYARFGGDRRYLRYAEYDQLAEENARLQARDALLPIKVKPSARQRQLDDLLLTPPALWEDILPPDAPPRPADFIASLPGEYPGPAGELLALGWELDLRRIRSQASRWRNATDDLARMSLDEGLLEGWPGEAASWAPYYALNLLGQLKAHQHAAALSRLASRRDDWLSDLLPGVWAAMGPVVEPELWRLLDGADRPVQQRGLAAMGLQALAEVYPKVRSTVIDGLIARLSASPPKERRLNAYLIVLLDQMNAVAARPAIQSAFEQGRVDLGIVEPEDVDMLNAGY
jgi:hypothetical protein